MDGTYYVDVYLKEYSIEWMIYNYGFVVPMFIIIVACLIASDSCEDEKDIENNVVLKVVLGISIIMLLSFPFLRGMIYDKYKDIHNAGRYCADPRFSESELCRAVEVEAAKKNGMRIYEFKYTPSKEQIKQMSAVVQRQEELNRAATEGASALKQEMIRDREREIAKIPVVKP